MQHVVAVTTPPLMVYTGHDCCQGGELAQALQERRALFLTAEYPAEDEGRNCRWSWFVADFEYCG